MSANGKLDPLAGVLFDNAFLGVILLSEGRVERVNEQASRMLGYKEAELKDREFEQLVLVPEYSLDSKEELLSKSHQQYSRVHLLLKDGKMPVELSIRNYQSSDGEKQVAMLADARTEELIEELKREFVTKVTHDLRSPLTAISGSLAILRSERMARLSDSVKNVVTIAERNCKRLILMVNEIIDLESLERGKIRLQPRKTNFDEIVNQAVEMVSAFCDENSVKVNSQSCSMPIQGDEERLTQIFGNILRNAIRGSEKGGTVEIVSSAENGWAEVKIKYRAKAEKHDAGDGSLSDSLAQRSLDVCKEVVALHKGYFGFEDADKYERCYWIRIPLVKAEE